MKVSPVSADLLIKLGLGVAVLGAVYFGFRKVSDSLTGAGGVLDTVADAVNPASADNLINKAVNAAGGALVTDPEGAGKNADGSWTLGGWLFDKLNPDTAQAVKNVTAPTGGHSAYWKS